MAEKLLEREFTTIKGTRIEILAWKVPESKKFPDGIKYKFQAYNLETGDTVLRYDNHKRHAGSRHHKHIGDEEVREIEFDSIGEVYRKFVREVKERE